MTFTNTFLKNFTKFYLFVGVVCLTNIFLTNIYAQDLANADISIPKSKTLKTNTINTTQTKIINNETPLIVKKGDVLTIKLDNPTNEKMIVRIHSSLGRLVKEYPQVKEGFLMETTTLLAGVYLVIIKKSQSREIRKVLVTD